MTGYRIEHPEDGFGIFTTRIIGTLVFPYCIKPSTFNYNVCENIRAKHASRMEPARWIPGFTRNHYCAYPSLDVLCDFISEDEIEYLMSLGFKLYEVKGCTQYDNQCLFLKDVAEMTEIRWSLCVSLDTHNI